MVEVHHCDKCGSRLPLSASGPGAVCPSCKTPIPQAAPVTRTTPPPTSQTRRMKRSRQGDTRTESRTENRRRPPSRGVRGAPPPTEGNNKPLALGAVILGIIIVLIIAMSSKKEPEEKPDAEADTEQTVENSTTEQTPEPEVVTKVEEPEPEPEPDDDDDDEMRKLRMESEFPSE